VTSQPTIPANPLENTPSYPTWVADKLLRDYYDAEWGMPVTDERGLFEALSLEAFQVGLSWRTILARREAFRRAFEGFNPGPRGAAPPTLRSRRGERGLASALRS